MTEVYEGNRNYIFENYAHADANAVLPAINALVDEGYRVWYDDGIELGTDYPEYIASHVYGCACFIMFVSRASVASGWCNAEVNYALDLKKPVLPIYLENVELNIGLRLRIGTIQAMFWYEFDSDVAFYRSLFRVPVLDSCLTDEGRRRRIRRRVLESTAAENKGVADEDLNTTTIG